MTKRSEIWEHFGESSPYFGVQTLKGLEGNDVGDSAKGRFFDSGEEYVSRVWRVVESHFDSNFKPQNALDFGCGVGRVLLPIAKRSESATGADISKAMLAEAEKNLSATAATNVTLVNTSEKLAELEGEYDFVHSFVVFQHIDPKLGVLNFEKLLGLLANGGIGVLQLQFSPLGDSAFGSFKHNILAKYPTLQRLLSRSSRSSGQRLMPMHSYDLNKIFGLLYKFNCHEAIVHFSDHGAKGALIAFRKQELTPF